MLVEHEAGDTIAITPELVIYLSTICSKFAVIFYSRTSAFHNVYCTCKKYDQFKS